MYKGARGGTVIVIGSGVVYPNSDPEGSYLHFT